MAFYRYRKSLAALICLVLVVLTAVTFQVFAEDTGEDLYVIRTPEDSKNAEENMMVGTLQERLTELGYYTEKVTLVLDATTRFSLSKFCQTNGLPFDEGGVRQSVWDALMSEDAIPAEGSETYTFISYGTESDAVLALQMRLKDLQYYEGLELVLKVYDVNLQTAIDRFCEINDVFYDRSGITPEVQELIYSNSALPYSENEEPLSLAEKFANYVMRDADLLVIVVPVFVVWIFIMFFVLIAAFFVVHLLRKRKAAQEAKANLQGTQKTRMGKNLKNMPPPLLEKKKVIHFQIDYQGKSRNVENDASHPVTIGRGAADIRLDSSDQGADLKHCVLFFKGAILMLQDESDKGTYVNNSLFHKCTTPVQSGDCIVIGAHHIFLRF